MLGDARGRLDARRSTVPCRVTKLASGPEISEKLAPQAAADEGRAGVTVAPAGPHAGPHSKPLERINYERIEDVLRHLPLYSRSLLKIKTPVRVTLASTRLPVQRILELAPGSLIQFQKTCDEPLDLEVGRRRVAQGEAVKVGEKFGLRITAIVLLGERFLRLRRERSEG
jgi:flagellar motor switch protein FliN